MDVAGTARKVEDALEAHYRANPDAPRPHVAVMGCVVNGPGEARGADIAVAGGDGKFALYVRGEFARTIPEADAAGEILALATAWRE